MSIWTRISDALAALRQGEPLSAIFDRLRTRPERSVAFTIAVIALSAKVAKADGLVTREEVAAFREVFTIDARDEKAAGKVFNLARQDVAGFDAYATRIAAMFTGRGEVLCDLFEGLFHIAVADGSYNASEDQVLFRVAEIFGLSSRQFRSVRARYVPDEPHDPYDVLGLDPGATLDAARAARAQIIRDCHPDRMIGRGLPEEAIKMAEARIAAVNLAWAEIQAEKGGGNAHRHL